VKVHELGHPVLYVRNLERSRRFYCDVLGSVLKRALHPALPVASAPGEAAAGS
jgi:extradiol dioxygenase family protein